MLIAIKNPAPVGPGGETWGDFHFGASLQQAFEDCGVRVVQHYWPEWERSDGEDVILVLRGRYRFRPPKGPVALLWALSHPATVSAGELDGYRRAYLASSLHVERMRRLTATPLSILLQCTDPARFGGFDRSPGPPSEGIVFVANSRGVRRDMLLWAAAAGVRPRVFGSGWQRLGFGDLVAGEYVPNAELAGLYRRSEAVLNDHWADMKHFGYVNNRIFDAVACGAPVISDDFPELRAVAGDAVLYARDGPSFAAACRAIVEDRDAVVGRVRRLAAVVVREHTFAARARRILDDLAAGAAPPSGPRAWRRRLVAAVRRRAGGRNEGRWAAVIDRAAALAPKRGERRVRILAFGADLGAAALKDDGRIAMLSAGIGPGPWDVGVDGDLSQLPPRIFDAVLFAAVEAGSATDDPRSASHATLAEGLVHRLREGGVFAAPAGFPVAGIDALGPKAIGRHGGFAFYRKIGPNAGKDR